ncbi:hypothetical protein NP493_4343g00006 [Ridgeia piscesae]|uniref:Uncharacterized protein n=2 Tax=Ridgeia piscesae TaxID=27915 RepID=A0AAD9MU87_RIDPI|nr:hypothetical protein NP493_4343g00006 [Ridgeia piscesae]
MATYHHPTYCYYNPVVGMQNTSDESDEATSHPIDRVPSRVGAAAGPEIVDVDTLAQKVVDDNTAFVVGGLVVEKVRNDVPFYYVGCAYCKKRMIVDDHGNLRFERHACVNGNTYFVVRSDADIMFNVRNLLVIDDLMSETDERVTKLFTKKSHHCNTSVIYLVQNLFPKGKESRTISINAQYMVLFKNPRDNKQVVNLAKQMYPGRVKYMQDAFRDATSVPHGYLFVDLKQSTPEHLRLRSNILPDSKTYQYAYIPKI